MALGPLRAVRRLLGRSTPRILRAATTLLVALCAVYGAWSVSVASNQHNQVEMVRATSAAAVFEGQSLRATLSDADATAAALFLTGPAPSTELRGDYDRAMADAAAAITTIADAGGSDPEAAAITDRLAAGLPHYATLVDLALTNHRQGFPLAQAYLAQATSFMRNQLLVDVDELVSREQDQLDRQLDRATSLPSSAGLIAVLATALVAIVSLQRWQARTFRRRLNPLLLLATLLLLGSLGAQLVVVTTLWNGIAATRTEGAEPLAHLTEIRVVAAQVLSDDTLRVVTADTVPAYISSSEASRTALIELLLTRDNQRLLGPIPAEPSPSSYLDGYWNELLDDRRQVSAVHRTISENIRYDADLAVAAASGDGEAQVPAVREHFDADLDRGASWAAARLDANIDHMADVLTWFRVAALALPGCAAVAVVLALRPRLAEYR